MQKSLKGNQALFVFVIGNNSFKTFYIGFLASSITISALIVMNMTFWKTMLKMEVPWL